MPYYLPSIIDHRLRGRTILLQLSVWSGFSVRLRRSLEFGRWPCSACRFSLCRRRGCSCSNFGGSLLPLIWILIFRCFLRCIGLLWEDGTLFRNRSFLQWTRFYWGSSLSLALSCEGCLPLSSIWGCSGRCRSCFGCILHLWSLNQNWTGNDDSAWRILILLLHRVTVPSSSPEVFFLFHFNWSNTYEYSIYRRSLVYQYFYESNELRLYHLCSIHTFLFYRSQLLRCTYLR